MAVFLHAPAGQRSLSRSEAQCPTCGRVFSTDGNCQRHKRPRTAEPECRDPAELGMVPLDRRGLVVWVAPGPTTAPWRHVEEMVGI